MDNLIKLSQCSAYLSQKYTSACYDAFTVMIWVLVQIKRLYPCLQCSNRIGLLEIFCIESLLTTAFYNFKNSWTIMKRLKDKNYTTYCTVQIYLHDLHRKGKRHFIPSSYSSKAAKCPWPVAFSAVVKHFNSRSSLSLWSRSNSVWFCFILAE